MTDVNAVNQNNQSGAEPNQAVDVNQQLANSLWNNTSATNAHETIVENSNPGSSSSEGNQSTEEEDKILSVDDYFRQEFGLDASAAKTEWETLRKLKETPPTPQEIQWANEESKRIFELLKDGKDDDVYSFLDQKKQLERLERFEVTDALQAAQILKANLQFKHKELSQNEIDRLFARQYSLPQKPLQGMDQTDDEYASSLEGWKMQVAEKEQDMMIDAKLAKTELPKYKSQIVLPDIQQRNIVQQGPTPEELAAAEAGRKGYLQALSNNYQNFKGFNVTAKDGDVQLPVEYTLSSDEVAASKAMLENLNVNDFFGTRWFDENGNPNIQLMQEDLYLLTNREKVFQKIANESAAQRFLHHQKNQNNININAVNQQMGLPGQTGKTESQTLAENIWKM